MRAAMLKRIFEYVLWAIAAFLLGMGYIFLLFTFILGEIPEETSLISFVTLKLFIFGVIYVGSTFGVILAALFILLDVFYLKRKWQKSKHFFLKRVISLLLLLIVVAVLHYLLEKTFDVI
ncbi:hypothetical protein [Thiomicrorhabdus sp.]|uniref:hypothetical protein n=1 Tax=Thiomicrorhabdus sp. TaxID=2039724 RepID=UPI002AA6D3CF|nr:hypothetical protein [Thiomicrorhabdus sp.]